jgi:hypothetical protein
MPRSAAARLPEIPPEQLGGGGGPAGGDLKNTGSDGGGLHPVAGRRIFERQAMTGPGHILASLPAAALASLQRVDALSRLARSPAFLGAAAIVARDAASREQLKRFSEATRAHSLRNDGGIYGSR